MKAPVLAASGVDSVTYLQPRVTRFTMPEKSISTPYTSLIRPAPGYTLIGGTDGIQVLRGSENYKLSMQGPVFLAADSHGTIHYLAEGDLGTLQLHPHRKPIRKSSLSLINSKYRHFNPLSILAFDSLVFMSTSEGVFVADDKEVRHHFFNHRKCHLFSDGESVYIYNRGIGLRSYYKGEFLPVERFAGRREPEFVSAFEFNRSRYLLTSEGTVYSASASQPEPEDPLPGQAKPTGVYQLPEGRLLVLDEQQVASVISGDGNFAVLSGAPARLPRYPVRSVCTDAFNDTWILYDFGVFKLECTSGIYSLELPGELTGTVLGSQIIGQDLYLATSGGLAHIRLKDNNGWSCSGIISPPKKEYINLLGKSGNTLFAAGNRSLYEIRDSRCTPIDSGNVSALLPVTNDLLLACHETGLSKYSRVRGFWRKDILDAETTAARSISFFQQQLWMVDNHGALYRGSPDGTGKQKVNLGSNVSLVSSFVFDSTLYFASATRLWYWDVTAQQPIPLHNELTRAFAYSAAFRISGEEAWYLDKSSARTVFLNHLSASREINNHSCLAVPGMLQRIIDLHVQDDHIWVTGEEMLIRLDRNLRDTPVPDPLIIDRAWIGKPASRSLKEITDSARIAYFKGQLHFELLNHRHLSDPKPLFRYRLLPDQPAWSPWDDKKQITLERPGRGRHTLVVEMRSVSTTGSDPVCFHMNLKGPFYAAWYAIVIYVLILLLISFLVYKWRMLGLKSVEVRMESELREKMDHLLVEKQKADQLVADLFPEGTAEEIKVSGRAKSKKFEMATVLFSDIQGFSHIAEEMNPEVLIDELDRFFFHFDSVVEKYNIEKIKTIGDAYMAAGGIPQKNTTNPVEVVLAGLEMQQYMNELKKNKAEIWDLRIGIHTGPVISGVVGHKKLSYDIWGDTVNTASRMESSGKPGRVNISGATFAYVKDYFICEYRGKLPVKYKGNIDMYFVNGLRPELSVDLQFIPNRRFFLKLQLMRMNDLQEYFFNEYLSDFPVTLHFHNKKHLLRVAEQTDLLCRSENTPEEDTLTTRTAGILIYSGIKDGTRNFENRSAESAREILPRFGYTEEQINRVCNLILATKKPFSPQNKQEEILIDARMEYLGRPDYIKMIKLLYLELKAEQGGITLDHLRETQIALQTDFEFNTIAARRLREVSSAEQIRNLKELKSI